MTIPRQLAPTVGLAHGGDEFLEGSFSGVEKLTISSDEEESSRKDLHCLQSEQSDLMLVRGMNSRKIRVAW